jgi:predicted nucleic acid-binding protein
VLQETPRHAEIAREIARTIPLLRGNLAHDLRIAALLKEHGVRTLCTRDTDFHRFGFLEVNDPLA